MLKAANLEDENDSIGLDGFGETVSNLVIMFRLVMSVGDFSSEE